MRKLVRDLVEAAFTLRQLEHEEGYPDPVRPAPGPAATRAQLEQLERYLEQHLTALQAQIEVARRPRGR
jgi:hypothetical protein